jgi:glycosyltransferase involved in cell wall biosynthesis
MTYGLWLDEHINQNHVNEAWSIIESHKNYIKHYSYLENKKVLELLQTSDVGLLPSYGETYGYSILESQACGCPVVTTNMPPFDEINNESTGWLVDVPLANEKGSKVSKLFSDEEKRNYSQTLENNLYQTLKDILNNPDQIIQKGKNSIRNIKENHDINRVTDQIETIYKEALGA